MSHFTKGSSLFIIPTIISSPPKSFQRLKMGQVQDSEENIKRHTIPLCKGQSFRFPTYWTPAPSSCPRALHPRFHSQQPQVPSGKVCRKICWEFKDFMSLLSQTGAWCQTNPHGTTGILHTPRLYNQVFGILHLFLNLLPSWLLEKIASRRKSGGLFFTTCTTEENKAL